MILKVEDITKKYKKKCALDRISLSFEEGICGLIGPNGSGKSTLLGVLCGAVKPDDGKIIMDDKIVTNMPVDYRNMIRVLYQKPPLIPDYTVKQTMEYGGILYGIEKTDLKMQTEVLLEKVGLSDCLHMKTMSLSGGMKQRLAIAQMLLGEAKILLFDEPTAGLDILERLRFKKIIENLKKDHIIIFSTHIYSDLEDLADRIVILENGKCSHDTKVADIGQTTIQDYVEKGLETGKW